MTRRPAYPQISEERSNLSQDTEFRRFLVSRQADEQREADRLQDEVDTLMAQAASKRQEQTERLNIVMACAGGIAAIDGKALRPAPTLTPHPAAVAIGEVLEEIVGNKEETE